MREHAEAQRAAAEAQKAADELARRERDLLIELETLKRAAELRPVRSATTRAMSTAGHRGRQPGAISTVWRQILATMTVQHPEGIREAQILEIAQAAGMEKIRLKDVRDRMEAYKALGYVVSDDGPLARWKITEAAAQRFNIDIGQEAPEDDWPTPPPRRPPVQDLDDEIPF